MNLSGVTSKVAAFVVENKRMLSIVAFALGTFAWTNWYFSAPKQFERFAKKITYQVFTRDMLDSALKTLPGKTTGGEDEPGIHCLGVTCAVKMEVTWYTDILNDKDPNSRVISYSVTARYFPQNIFFGQSQLLPQKIMWTESAWEWVVAIKYPSDSSKNLYFHGNWADLNNVPVADGNFFYNQLSAIGSNMHRGSTRELNSLKQSL